MSAVPSWTRLWPHAVGLGVLTLGVLAWGPVGLLLPDLDALLAPGGAEWLLLVGTGLLLLLRTLAVLLLPGVAAVLLVDAAVVLLQRPERAPLPPPRGTDQTR